MQHAINYFKSPKTNMKTFFTPVLMGMLIFFMGLYSYEGDTLQKDAIDINMPGIHYFSVNTKRTIIRSTKLAKERGELL